MGLCLQFTYTYLVLLVDLHPVTNHDLSKALDNQKSGRSFEEAGLSVGTSTPDAEREVGHRFYCLA